jgi:chromosome segregation ATPase
MSADNDLDYWARTENPDKKELKRVLRRVADAADAIEIELHQLCAREEALLMGSRPRHPEELAKVRRERAAMRAKSKQARDEVEVMHLAIAGELSGAVALMRQRDEARAEVERLSVYVDKTRASRNQAKEERDAALEEVERLRSDVDAFRRGAEAMREACARWMSEREGISQWVYDDALSALPIPEEP